MAFDYDATDTPDEVVSAVAAEMSSGGLKEESDEERDKRFLANQAWREEQRRRDEQHRLAYQQERKAKAEADRREAAIAAAAVREQEQRKRSVRIERDVRDRELANLRLQSAQQAAWQRHVEQAAHNAVAQQYRDTLMGELEALINPPASPPESEPDVVYLDKDEMGSPHLGDPDFNPKLLTRIIRR